MSAGEGRDDVKERSIRSTAGASWRARLAAKPWRDLRGLGTRRRKCSPIALVLPLTRGLRRHFMQDGSWGASVPQHEAGFRSAVAALAALEELRPFARGGGGAAARAAGADRDARGDRQRRPPRPTAARTRTARCASRCSTAGGQGDAHCSQVLSHEGGAFGCCLIFGRRPAVAGQAEEDRRASSTRRRRIRTAYSNRVKEEAAADGDAPAAAAPVAGAGATATAATAGARRRRHRGPADGGEGPLTLSERNPTGTRA